MPNRGMAPILWKTPAVRSFGRRSRRNACAHISCPPAPTPNGLPRPIQRAWWPTDREARRTFERNRLAGNPGAGPAGSIDFRCAGTSSRAWTRRPLRVAYRASSGAAEIAGKPGPGRSAIEASTNGKSGFLCDIGLYRRTRRRDAAHRPRRRHAALHATQRGISGRTPSTHRTRHTAPDRCPGTALLQGLEEWRQGAGLASQWNNRPGPKLFALLRLQTPAGGAGIRHGHRGAHALHRTVRPGRRECRQRMPLNQAVNRSRRLTRSAKRPVAPLQGHGLRRPELDRAQHPGAGQHAVNATVSWCSVKGNPRGACNAVLNQVEDVESEIATVDRISAWAQHRDGPSFYGLTHQEVALRRDVLALPKRKGRHSGVEARKGQPACGGAGSPAVDATRHRAGRTTCDARSHPRSCRRKLALPASVIWATIRSWIDQGLVVGHGDRAKPHREGSPGLGSPPCWTKAAQRLAAPTRPVADASAGNSCSAATAMRACARAVLRSSSHARWRTQRPGRYFRLACSTTKGITALSHLRTTPPLPSLDTVRAKASQRDGWHRALTAAR